MSGRADASRELLLGLYALESRAIDLDQLIAAVRNWSRSDEASLSEILGEAGLDDVAMARLEDRLRRGAAGPDAESELTVTHASSRPWTPPDPGVQGRRGTPGERFQDPRPHARGGLGEVFLALDTELNRPVAVKELAAPRAHDPAAQARFLLEAEITGRLEHPGIVPVYSLSRYDDGRPYYAMRLIEGGTLSAAIEAYHRGGATVKDRELAFRRLLRNVIEVCNAVAYAHSRGVVHRDLKPENIMLGRFGETLVVDWGIAKRFDEDQGEEGQEAPADRLPDDPAMTRPGTVIGTPRYMSPEQAAGDRVRVGPASDIYSLGAILYHVLVGHGAFPDGDVRSILQKVRRGIFPAPRRVRKSVDPALEAICLKAMAPNPSDRHATALELASELESWLADVRYRDEQQRALSQMKGTLARLCLERAQNGFGRGAHDEGMLWLARALESAPADPLDFERAIRTSLTAWHAGEGLLERRLRHGDEVHALAFAPEGRRLATACQDGTARLWDIATGSALSPRLKHEGPVRAVAFHPNGTSMLTAGDDGMIRRWDTLTGEPRGEPIRCGASITALEFSPDGARVATACGPGGPVLWDAATGAPLAETDGQGAGARATAFSPDGSLLAIADLDGSVHIVESSTGRPLAGPGPEAAAVFALVFDPAGRMLLMGGLNGETRLWDVVRGVAVLSLSGTGTIRGLEFRPGGTAFATAGDDGAARLWDVATGRPIGERLDHRSRIDALAFRPDGTMLATGSHDGTVRLWCAGTGLSIGPVLSHGGAVRQLVFSRDGTRLGASGGDPSARCWQVPDPVEADAERVSCWVRITTGLEFDPGDAIRPLDGPTGWDLRRRLNDLGGPPLR
jgi:WD40 repeat protein